MLWAFWTARHPSMKAIYIAVCFLLPTVALRAQSVSTAGDFSPSPSTTPLWNVGTDLVIGDTGPGSMGIAAGGEVNSGTGYVGRSGGSSGTITVDGAASLWASTGQIIIAEGGTADLMITGGGSVQSAGGVVGYYDGALGTVGISGAASAWENSGTLNVGLAGEGEVTVSAGGKLTSTGAAIGFGVTGPGIATGVGTVGIAGAGSSWIANSPFPTDAVYVGGYYGIGTLAVSDGALFQSNLSVYVGGHPFGIVGISGPQNGTVTVTGGNSLFHLPQGVIEVGILGTGQLTVSDGAEMRVIRCNIAHRPGSTGTVKITGDGTTWLNTGGAFDLLGMWVGGSGNGTLEVEAGAKLNSFEGRLARYAGSTGTATVTGAGTFWENDWERGGSMHVGETGDGLLTVSEGAHILDHTGYVATYSNSTGEVNVTGAGSWWENYADISVGNEGTGTLTISDGGKTSSFRTYIGYTVGSVGRITVDGATSLLTASVRVEVGINSAGTLDLINGGTVSADGGAGTLSLAKSAGSVGTLNIGSADLLNPTAAGVVSASQIILGPGSATLNFNQNNAITFSVPISGTGGVVQRGVGSTRLTGANTYSGPTTVSGGTLLVNSTLPNSTPTVQSGGTLGGTGVLPSATVQSGGAIAPGDGGVGQLSISTNLALDNGSTTRIELGGTTPLAFDRIFVDQTLAYGGSLVLTLVGGFEPSIGNTFQIFHGFNAHSGGFASVVFTNPGYTGTFNPATGTLTVTGTDAMTWVNPGNGNWFSAGNWSRNRVPLASDHLTVSSGSPQVSSPGAVAKSVTINGGGNATVLSGGSLSLEAISVGTTGQGVLTVQSGGSITVNGGAGTVYLAEEAGSTGTLNIGSPDLGSPTTAGTVNAAAIAFGDGDGVIQFNQSNSIVFAPDVSGDGRIVHRGTGATTLVGEIALPSTNTFGGITSVRGGTLVLDGSDAILSQPGASLFVGELDGDHGTFVIKAGAQVLSSYGNLGLRQGSVGVATVTGAGSSWQSFGSLSVGYEGSGALTIADGALVQSSDGYVGYWYDTAGEVLVTGTNSQWTTDYSLTVGNAGDATLTIAGGAAVVVGGGTNTLYIATTPESSGTVNIGSADLLTPTTGGMLSAGSIVFGNGTGLIQFNQSDAFTLASGISGGGGVSQRGSGTTTLSGASTYTGPTLVSGGTLLINGSIAGSDVLVEEGGILGGTGAITGNLTIDGTLSPGASPGVLTVNGNVDIQSTASLRMELRGLVQGTDHDFLNVSGLLTFNGNLVIEMLYELRDIGISQLFTLATADSPILGTIGNLIGDRVFTEDGFGSFRVMYGGDNNLVIGEFQATALTYPLWVTAWDFENPGDADFGADPDFDGVLNGVEYSLGMNPLLPDVELLPSTSIVTVSGLQYLALTYERPIGANEPTDITYEVKRATTLSPSDWLASGLVGHSVTPGSEPGFESVTVRSTTPIGTPNSSREFLRLAVELNAIFPD